MPPPPRTPPPPLPLPSSTSIYVPSTPGSWTGDRGWREGGKQKNKKKNQEQHSLTWIQAGKSSLVETLHHFQLDLQPTAHRWKVDWERGRGQTGRRTNSGQTRHLTHNHSHTIESWDRETGDAMTILFLSALVLKKIGFKGTADLKIEN